MSRTGSHPTDPRASAERAAWISSAGAGSPEPSRLLIRTVSFAIARSASGYPGLRAAE